MTHHAIHTATLILACYPPISILVALGLAGYLGRVSDERRVRR